MTLTYFTDAVIRSFRTYYSFSTICNYQSTLHSVLDFHHGDVPLSVVFSRDFLLSYQNHLLGLGICRNTIAFYMRVLRALYHRAVAQRRIKSVKHLFVGIITTEEATVKRSLPASVVKLLATSDLSEYPELEFSRDMFMLSLYLQGMPFIDLAHLRHSDLQGGRILCYRRHKTDVEITVGLDERALRILSKYKCSSDSPYLLPIIRVAGAASEETRQYSNSLRNHNRHLKRICVLLDIDENLSSYVARHTWATLAHHHGVGMHVISQALGHRKEETTHTYVRQLDVDCFLAANRIVIDAVFSGKKPSGSILKPLSGSGLRGFE
ncbi:site-specific integrase [Bacteroides sp. 224]|uniref:site-specific integrase n=1 Tax=Bacteroides sp. 224 TaxID=2302936 RepID=UPI0013D2FB3D|nr:site-specific integrase [Bacteroides sp. 224]NDV67245.1 site-specific integrase [Bacteroides sp. 224]